MRALDVLREQTERPRVREVLAEVASRVRDGRSFSESLAIYPRIFSPLYVSMVRSGEVAGMLAGVLAGLADFTEKEEEVYGKVRSALVYPALILLVGMGTVAVLLIFVIPKLVSLFQEVGQTLPLPTRILIEVSRWLASYWWLVVLVAAGGAFLVRRGTRSPGGRLAIDRTTLRLPVWGALIKIADTYEREADRLIRSMTSLVEPVMILIVGAVVGFIVISMMLPIFQIDLLAR